MALGSASIRGKMSHHSEPPSQPMITYRTRGLSLLHCAGQTAAAAGLYWAWVFCLLYGLRPDGALPAERYLAATAALVGGLIVDFLRVGGTAQRFLDLGGPRNHVISLRQAATALLSLLLFLFAAHDLAISRLFLFTFVPLLYALLYATNRWFPPLLADLIFNGKRRQRTIVVGSRKGAARLEHWLSNKLRYGLEVVGLVTNDASSKHPTGMATLGTESDLERVLHETQASQLLVAELPRSSRRISQLGDLCDRLGIHLLIMNNLEERIGRAVSFVHDGGMPFLSLREEPLECPFNRLLKRAVDVALSLPLVVCILPFTHLLVWLIHRAQSPGPLIFRQKRTGIQGKDFLIFKYRTMHVGDFDETVQATQADPRVFRAGIWLRKLSIDELPQFLNVLRGEMSIVGPRPHLKTHDALFSTVASSYKVRALVRPGITGLAQVRGFRGEARHPEEIVSRVHSDLYYVEHWSFVLDTSIICQTALQMFLPPRTAV